MRCVIMIMRHIFLHSLRNKQDYHKGRISSSYSQLNVLKLNAFVFSGGIKIGGSILLYF